jgi:hypothetical protein
LEVRSAPPSLPCRITLKTASQCSRPPRLQVPGRPPQPLIGGNCRYVHSSRDSCTTLQFAPERNGSPWKMVRRDRQDTCHRCPRVQVVDEERQHHPLILQVKRADLGDCSAEAA